MTTNQLADQRVLIVEDEFFLAEEMARDLSKAGAVVIGPVRSVAKALALISDQELDTAVLDFNLGGETASAIADALSARGIPFIFTSGYDDAVLTKSHHDVPRCMKPTEIRTIADTLVIAMQG